MNPLPTRRSFLSVATATSALTLAGCSSSSGKKAATASSKPSTPADPFTPMNGFSSSPVWRGVQGQAVPDAGVVWSQNNAWMLSTDTPGNLIVTAYNPQTGQAATHTITHRPSTGFSVTSLRLYPLVAPSTGVVLYGDDTTWGFTISGTTITAKSTPRAKADATWLGDSLMVPSMLGNAADQDPTNPNKNLTSTAQAFDPAKGAWVTLPPKNAGWAVMGLTSVDGDILTVEVNPTLNGTNNPIKVGANTGQAPVAGIGAALGGTILVNTNTGALPLDATLRSHPAWTPSADSDSPTITGPQALSADRQTMILNNGLLYDATNSKVTAGTWTTQSAPTWDLRDVALTGTTIYANATTRPSYPDLPAGGAYKNVGALTANVTKGVLAPSFITPDGHAVFVTQANTFVITTSA